VYSSTDERDAEYRYRWAMPSQNACQHNAILSNYSLISRNMMIGNWNARLVVLALTSAFIKVADSATWNKNETFVVCPEMSSSPLPQWELTNPNVTADVTGINLQYDLNAEIPDEWIDFEIFDSSCSMEIKTQLPIYSQENLFNDTYANLTAPILAQQTRIDVNDKSGTDSSKLDKTTKTIQIYLEINPLTLSNSSIYTELERSGIEPAIESRGEVGICVRFSVWNGPRSSDSRTSSSAVEVSYLETILTFPVSFFVIKEQNVEVRPLDSNVRRELLQQQEEAPAIPSTCKDTWGIQVFICPAIIVGGRSSWTSPELLLPSSTSTSPLTQGSIVRICLQPNRQAHEDGVILSDISSLSFSRSPSVTQSAIVGGVTQQLTITFCEDGWKLCVVETTLLWTFYEDIVTAGTVAIQGTVWIRLDDPASRRSASSSSIRGQTRRADETPLSTENSNVFQMEFSLDFEVAAQMDEDRREVEKTAAVATRRGLLLAALLGLAPITITI
jgi:hypothetical protein